jgi:curved DNA-binding protein CbpA
MSGRVATYYDILRVSPCTRPDVLRASYRRLAQRFHPDKMPGNADAERVMAALNEAYAVLSDPQQRARYDELIAEARSRRQLADERMLAHLDDPGAAWPWYLLFATAAFATMAIGIAVYKNYVPGASTAAAATSVQTAASPLKSAFKLISN